MHGYEVQEALYQNHAIYSPCVILGDKALEQVEFVFISGF